MRLIGLVRELSGAVQAARHHNLRERTCECRSLCRRASDTFDYAYENEPGGVLVHTVHGLVSGRAHAIMLLERFIRHMKEHDDVWFGTLSEICDRWTD